MSPPRTTTSELSAHLHFGHISPLTIALAVSSSDAPREDVDAYLEELIVRRELSINFVARNPHYDRLAGCPEWARRTLAQHADDPRPVVYSARQLEHAETHDPLWNAAQLEMVLTGRMHNYLRMYWAKKILEWSPDAETAFHDRAGPERPIRDGRPRPQRLHGSRLGDRRQARPPVARAADLRDGPVHELREHPQEVRLGGISPGSRRCGGAAQAADQGSVE